MGMLYLELCCCFGWAWVGGEGVGGEGVEHRFKLGGFPSFYDSVALGVYSLGEGLSGGSIEAQAEQGVSHLIISMYVVIV